MVLSLVCGAECQIHSVGSGAAADSHWSATSGTPAITSSPVRSGSYAFDFNASGSAVSLAHEHSTTSRYAYTRFYFQTPDATPSAEMAICRFTDSLTTEGAIVVTTGGVLRAVADGTTYSSTNDVTISADTWYGVEVEFDADVGLKWRVWTDGGGWTSSESVADASADVDTVFFGAIEAITHRVYIDDIAIGFESGLYDDTGTNGVSGKVLRLDPTSDGTHSSFDAGDFYNSYPSGPVASSDTDVHTYLDTPDMETGEYGIEGFISSTTSDYVEVNFEDELVRDDPRGVAVVAAYQSLRSEAGTPGKLDISDNGSTWDTMTATAVGADERHYIYDVMHDVPSGVVLAYDFFGRTVAGGLGTSDSGHDWGTDDADWDVTPSYGYSSSVSSSLTAYDPGPYLDHTAKKSTRILMLVEYTRDAVEGNITLNIISRQNGGTGAGSKYYRCLFQFRPDNDLALLVQGRKDGWQAIAGGALASYVVVDTWADLTAEKWWCELITYEGSTNLTEFEARVWEDGESRPEAASAAGYDTDSDLDIAGYSGHFWGTANTTSTDERIHSYEVWDLSGAWTRTDINNLRARFYGNGNTGDNVSLNTLALEVEWTKDDVSLIVRPDGDSVTTGWTSTPLWSKIDDGPDTPDATVITATAS